MKPFIGDRCCDEIIDKRAPLPWVEAQDQPRKGAEENKNGAPGAELSPLHTHEAPKNITTTSRN